MKRKLLLKAFVTSTENEAKITRTKKSKHTTKLFYLIPRD